MATPATRGRKARVTRQLVFQRLLQLADRKQISFRNAIQGAFKLAQRVSLETLANMVRTGNEAAILGALGWEDRGLPALEAMLPALQAETARAAARMAERLLPGDLEYRFDITNPVSVRQAVEHSNKLVTEINAQTREGLRRTIANAIQEGLPPLKAAKTIRESVGLRSDQVATLERMREEGASERELSRARDRKLRERSLLIARTETLWSANEGQRMLWEQGRDASVIPETAQQEWIVTPDERLCDVCEPLDGKTWAIGSTITTQNGELNGPPAHPQCRCTASLVV